MSTGLAEEPLRAAAAMLGQESPSANGAASRPLAVVESALAQTHPATYRRNAGSSRSIAVAAWARSLALTWARSGGGWVGTSNLTVTNLTTGRSITGTNSGTSSGFLVGGGVEYAITNNWTVKAEYDYLGLSRRTFIVPVGSPFFIGDNFRSGGRNVQMAKIGFNYLFNASGFLQR